MGGKQNLYQLHNEDTLVICTEGAWWFDNEEIAAFDGFYAERPDRAEVWEHLCRSSLGRRTYRQTLREFVDSGIFPRR